MRYFEYVEPDDESAKSFSVVVLSEQDILDQYFEYWSTNMTRAGKTNLISFDRCIEDFCVIHWATEIK